jgi:hypothetical protein
MDRRAAGGKQFRDGFADAAAGTGDDGLLVGQFKPVSMLRW